MKTSKLLIAALYVLPILGIVIFCLGFPITGGVTFFSAMLCLPLGFFAESVENKGLGGAMSSALSTILSFAVFMAAMAAIGLVLHMTGLGGFIEDALLEIGWGMVGLLKLSLLALAAYIVYEVFKFIRNKAKK